MWNSDKICWQRLNELDVCGVAALICVEILLSVHYASKILFLFRSSHYAFDCEQKNLYRKLLIVQQ